MRSALPIFVRTAVFVFFFAASAVRTTLYVEEAQLREAVKAHEAALPAFGPFRCEAPAKPSAFRGQGSIRTRRIPSTGSSARRFARAGSHEPARLRAFSSSGFRSWRPFSASRPFSGGPSSSMRFMFANAGRSRRAAQMHFCWLRLQRRCASFSPPLRFSCFRRAAGALGRAQPRQPHGRGFSGFGSPTRGDLINRSGCFGKASVMQKQNLFGGAQ